MRAPSISRVPGITALAMCAMFALLAPTPALAKPEWAKPYLDLPAPAGPYIAKNDVWAVVYGEVEFALTATNTIEARHHLLLENLSDRPESFKLRLYDDVSERDLRDPGLFAQRTIWHRINVEKKAVNVNMKGGERILYTSVEDLEPHKRVVMEYTLADKLGFFAWTAGVPLAWPIAKIRYCVEPESAAKGLVLELHAPQKETMPAGFTRETDGSYTVTAVPAWQRIGSKSLLYQPETHELYPYFVASVAGSPDQTFPGFVKRYRAEWNKRVATIDVEYLKSKAAAIAGDAATLPEKAARLAAYVQRDIQYDDSNEQSVEGWLPIGAMDTLRSLKADCKGKVMLLQALFKAVGIESVPIALHAGKEFSIPEGRVGGYEFNHVIMAATLPGADAYAGVLRDGPGKGMLLFDPTWSEGSFGRTLPGYEDVTAMFVGEADTPLFQIHTSVPSAASVTLRLDVRLTDDGFTGIEVTGNDAGASPLLGSLLRGGTAAQRKDLVLRTLDDVLPHFEIQSLNVSGAPVFPPGASQVDLKLIALRGLQEMEKSALLPSPLGVAAAIAGLPQSLQPMPPPRPDDAVTLAPPWDRKRNTYGTSTVVDAAVTLALPPTLTWTPLPARHEDRPWVHAILEWSPGDQPNTWQGKLHLELPRGSWPDEERKTRLKVMDELFTTISSPLLLSRSEAR